MPVFIKPTYFRKRPSILFNLLVEFYIDTPPLYIVSETIVDLSRVLYFAPFLHKRMLAWQDTACLRLVQRAHCHRRDITPSGRLCGCQGWGEFQICTALTSDFGASILQKQSSSMLRRVGWCCDFIWFFFRYIGGSVSELNLPLKYLTLKRLECLGCSQYASIAMIHQPILVFVKFECHWLDLLLLPWVLISSCLSW